MHDRRARPEALAEPVEPRLPPAPAEPSPNSERLAALGLAAVERRDRFVVRLEENAWWLGSIATE